MSIIKLFIGGSVLPPYAGSSLKEKKKLADESVKDKSVTVDRVLAARMRNALISEANILEYMTVTDFRHMLALQGFNTSRFSDDFMLIYMRAEASNLKSIALKLLRDDLIKAETPIIISGNISGAVSMVAKILGPTVAAEFNSIAVSIWWSCKSDCRIESIHFSDKKLQRIIRL